MVWAGGGIRRTTHSTSSTQRCWRAMRGSTRQPCFASALSQSCRSTTLPPPMSWMRLSRSISNCWATVSMSRLRASADGFAAAESLEAFFEACDVLTLHLRLNETTRAIVKLADLSRMKPTAPPVNIPPADLIEEGALGRAPQPGRPGNAAGPRLAPPPQRAGRAAGGDRSQPLSRGVPRAARAVGQREAAGGGQRRGGASGRCWGRPAHRPCRWLDLLGARGGRRAAQHRQGGDVDAGGARMVR